MILFEDFVWRALAAGMMVAAAAGPLGCFVVWRRMAYFGETMAHGALLGVALGLTVHAPVTAGVAVVCAVIAGGLSALRRRGGWAADTLLGILSHAALAGGLVALGFMDTVRVDLLGYLFGDILAVGPGDLVATAAGSALALAALLRLWRPLLSITVNADIARAEGVRAEAVELAFMGLLALVVAAAIQIVGILLVTAMLVIPAAAARAFARSPEGMAAWAVVVGVAAVGIGITGSATLDTPAGPSIVLAAFALFLAALAARRNP